MNFDREESKEGSQTCHLCGKVQCGQRLGRVKCCLCNRIFCLQQLSRKFHIMASANDPYFKCPRCTGICCCVSNCQKPPPHVHCKVYKVRQNKLKQYPDQQQPQSQPIAIPESISPKPIISEMPMITQSDQVVYTDRTFSGEPTTPISPTQWEGISGNWQDTQSIWQMSNLEVPGIQNGDGLTQLNLRLLDNADQTYYNSPNQGYEGFRKFSDNLKVYFDGWQDMNDYDRNSLEGRILAEAAKLQLKAAKTDVLFKMLDSFNKNSIQVTVTWNLLDNSLERKTVHKNTLPSLFTIVRHYPTVLFTLENNSDFEENTEAGKISAVKDVKSLCTCIALLDNSFRRFADVTMTEKWTEPDMSYKTIGNIDQKKLKEMISYAEQSQKVMENSTSTCRVCVSYSRSKEETYFENLPLISLILKRVSNDFPDIVFSLYRMVCDDKRVVCVLQFSDDKDWVKVINGYESSIEVCTEEQFKASSMSRVNSQLVLLDL